MTKDEVLDLALEALESADWYINQLEITLYSDDDAGTHEYRLKVQQAITAIKQARSAQQEPVGVFVEDDDIGHVRLNPHLQLKLKDGDKLYTASPAAPVPLTDEEIIKAVPGGIYDCLNDPWDCGVGDGDTLRSIKKDVLRIARAIERAHGITEKGQP